MNTQAIIDSPSSQSSAASSDKLWGLLAGFGLVTLLLAALTIYGVRSYSLAQQDMNQIVGGHSLHIQLLHQMQRISQKRTVLKYEIVQSDDAFEQDEKILEYHAIGGKFMALHQKLTSMKLEDEERRMLAAQSAASGEARERQDKVIELALAGDRSAANQLLISEAIPRQLKAMAILTELIQYNRLEIENIQHAALTRSQQQQSILAATGSLAMLLTLAIGWQVWRRIRGLLGRLQNAHREQAGFLRTLEYQKIAIDKHAIVSIADPAGLITMVNEKFCLISQYSADELIGHKHNILNSNYHPHEFFVDMWQTIASGNVWQGKIRNRRKDGSFYWVASTIVPFLDATGKPYQYVSIRTDITPLVETEQSLLAAMEIAEHANRAKSQFLASMSHEMRTPMNAVLGFAQLMEIDESLSPDNQDNVKEILKAGRHLLELITEILNLEKIESGNIELCMEPVNLCEVVNECLALIHPQAMVQSIQIESADCAKILLRADRMRLKQVLLNLLSNAVKYNQSGGNVRLHFSYENGQRCRILVSDTGQGIPQNRLAEMFQPFNRLGAESGTIQGSGIGLTISRQLVELMGGKIGFESAVGVGSTFWVELPRERRQIPRGLENTQPTVLYVDDRQDNIKLVAQILGQRPHIHLLTAHTPELCIELALARHPDLILLDINLPGLDDFEALRKLQQNPATRDIPVIAITTNDLPNDVSKVAEAGFVDFLTQPLDMQRLIALVDKVLLELPQYEGVDDT
ncbi:MAG: ATP-binding protein [Pseudomonadota bacterium]